MKNILAIVFVFAFANLPAGQAGAYAQKIEGIATYQTQRHVDLKMDGEGGMTSEMEKSIQEQLRKQFQKEYELTFKGPEAIWKEVPSLNKPQAPSSSGISIVLSGNSDILYQNIAEKTYKQESDLMGKVF